jgi:hypothetical protein
VIKKLQGRGCDAQAIAAAEQQAHGGVTSVIAKREGDARGRAPAPVLLLLWNGFNGIKMRIALLERVLRDERSAAIGGRRVLLLIEDHHNGDVEGARGVVANLNVGVEERHVAEPLAERDELMDDAKHIGRVRVRCHHYYYYHCCCCSGRLAAVPLL